MAGPWAGGWADESADLSAAEMVDLWAALKDAWVEKTAFWWAAQRVY
jgi:hypothetical protein